MASSKKSSKTEARKKSSKTEARKKSSKTEARKKSLKTEARKKSLKTEARKKSSKTEVETREVLMLIIGGILMIYAGVSGSIGIYETLVEYAKDYLGPSVTLILEVLLIILGIIASLGGMSVLAGVYIIKKGRKRTGKLIIGIGAGMGLIGLILLIVTTVIGGEGLIGVYQLIVGMATGASGLGVLLTIFGRMRV